MALKNVARVISSPASTSVKECTYVESPIPIYPFFRNDYFKILRF